MTTQIEFYSSSVIATTRPVTNTPDQSRQVADALAKQFPNATVTETKIMAQRKEHSTSAVVIPMTESGDMAAKLQQIGAMPIIQKIMREAGGVVVQTKWPQAPHVPGTGKSELIAVLKAA